MSEFKDRLFECVCYISHSIIFCN